MHELANGMCVTCRPVVAKFNPAELRDGEGQWTKSPGGALAKATKKIRDAIDSGDSSDADLLDAFDELDADGFPELPDRLQKDVRDELDLIVKTGEPKHRDRAAAKLAELDGNAAPAKKRAPAKSARPATAPASTPAKPAAPPAAAPKARPKTSTFDEANAAEGAEALAMAAPRGRVMYEATLSPADRQKFLAEVEHESPRWQFLNGGTGARADVGDAEAISHADHVRITESVDDYMLTGYKPINDALHAANGGPLGPDVPDDVRQKIADIDRLVSLTRTSEDAIFYRGTRFEGDPPDEIVSPAFSSTTAVDVIARDFAKGNVGGLETGSTNRPGTPTVIEIRVPKGTNAVQLSPAEVAGEVLLPRGVRLRKVEDKGMDYGRFQVLEGVRYVVYEVVPE